MTEDRTSRRAERIDSAAALLIEARTAGRPIDTLPDDVVPVDGAEAMAVDDRVAELTGWEVLGWKIGCTSEHAMTLLRSPGPLAGRIYAISQTGVELGQAELGVNQVTDPMVEGEFAFTIGSAIEPGQPISRRAGLAAVASIHPAIEVVGGRFTNFLDVPLVCLMADAGTNTHLVLGPAAAGFDPDRLVSTPGVMTVDGTVTGRGTGADVLGDPVDVLLWLIDHLGRRGFALTPGQVVSTGTLTQVSPLPAGSTAVASFDGVGRVTVSRSG